MIKRLYAELNLMYLKLFQYEKHLDQKIVDPMFDQINSDIDELILKYNDDYHLESMQLDEIMYLSTLKPLMTELTSNNANQLLSYDYQAIESLKKKLN